MPRIAENASTPSTQMPPLAYDGPLNLEFRQRLSILEGYGMSRAEAEVWAGEELGLLPVAGLDYPKDEERT